MVTLRTHEIGVDRYSPEKTELDKNDLGTSPNETIRQHKYPELYPGRALVDLSSGTLLEIMHRTHGVTDTVGGTKNSLQEYWDWQEGEQTGQTWGGIFQSFHIAYVKRPVPTPNPHAEIPAPTKRPPERNIQDLRPERFCSEILLDGDRPRPFLLLERPQASYEEVMPGETYDVVGWYWPVADEPDARVRDVANMADQFPEIAGVEGTEVTVLTLPGLDFEFEYDADTDDDFVFEFSPDSTASGSQAGAASIDFTTRSTTTDFHVRNAAGGYLAIESPYEAKEDIKGLSRETNWDSTESVWKVSQSTGALAELIREFTASGWTFTVDGSVLTAHADSHVETRASESVTVTLRDVLTYAFEVPETTTEAGSVALDGTDHRVQVADQSASLLELVPPASDQDALGKGTAVDTPGTTHVTDVTDSEVRLTCPRNHNELVKALNFQRAQYEFDYDQEEWVVNRQSGGALLTKFLQSGETLTITWENLAALGEVHTEEPASTQVEDPDRTSLEGDTDLFPHTESSYSDQPTLEFECGGSEGDGSDGLTSVLEYPTDESLSLFAIDCTLYAHSQENRPSLSAVDKELDCVPQSVATTWHPMDATEMDYQWRHPETGEWVGVKEVPGWGTEFAVYVNDADGPEEHVVTLANEQMAAHTAIVHLKAMTSW